MNNTVQLQPTVNNPLVADALDRAKALASGKVLKRPSEEYLEGPIHKKVHQVQVPNMNFTGGPGPGMTSEQVMVPDNMVGLIIGRGGEQITKLQAESGCKIQMSQENMGTGLRLCTLTGSGEALSIAKSMIEQII